MFNQYVYPNRSISFGAKNVTGITKSSGKLFCHGKLADAVEVNADLNSFGLRLKELCGRVVLVAHNVRAFDVKHFSNNLKKRHLKDLLMHSFYLEIFFQKNTCVDQKNYMRILSVKLM